MRERPIEKNPAAYNRIADTDLAFCPDIPQVENDLATRCNELQVRKSSNKCR